MKNETTENENCECKHNRMRHNKFMDDNKPFGCVDCDCIGFKEKKKAWYAKFEERTYKGVKYIMYDATPQEAETKIKGFIDSIGYDLPNIDISILTEGSKAVLIDLWVYDSFVSERDIYSKVFLITRKKNNKGKYGYRIRHTL